MGQNVEWISTFIDVEIFGSDEFYVQITTPNRLLEKTKLSFHSWSSLSSIMDAQMGSSKFSFDLLSQDCEAPCARDATFVFIEINFVHSVLS